ncbi:MAG: hypothetical protein ACJ77K_03340 [Bacteroidia bacterium]
MDPENSLENQKLQEEIEKLRRENAELKKPFWKTTAFYATFIPLIFSICLNIRQSRQFDAELAQKIEGLNIEKGKLEVENGRLELEIQQYEDGTAVTGEAREKAKKDLSQLDSIITQDEDFLASHQVSLMKEQSEYDGIAESKKNSPTSIALKQNIGIDKQAIEDLKERLEEGRARRSELEKIINGK